ncbi:xanthine dehydrogenase family protein molybdopterin-binding subunit [Hydrogenivirga sp. 128-5-R1-1]|uniref:xanthine dehydrogenase family protein molybdopterin-binding subunit n=1 Tax=Hydrogenivirga sp. 128-5-R1-1 TaxID=392423 RepID=UPI00015F3628|nr:xanthine dehydrogenase family protein molybdopterin-binding subunit [Hydrogenivirga sp. 128-5-R1-1]EDP76397.1 aldehyde dehydrogenase [Hydrogenivirga sp. 128-5-R1-1]
MITRREFFKLGGLSLVVVATPKGFDVVKASELKRHSPRLWINLSEDNYLTVFVNKSEMGQGVYTGIAQLVADELDFPWERVRARPAPAGKAYVDPYMGSQLTGGSTSIRHMFGIMRSAGAAMRDMLLQTASQLWRVPKNRLKAELGYVIDTKSGRRVPYGKLSSSAMKLPVPLYPKLKEPEEFRYIGKSLPRIDLEDKVNGSARFGLDHFFEGQIYAVIERPPFGGRVVSYDSSKTRKVKGVTHVFRVGKGVAVCGESPTAVLEGRKKLRVKYSRSSVGSTEDLKEHYLGLLKRRGFVARKDGDPKEAYEKSGKKIELTYLLPYLYHACMEPMSCTVKLDREGCTIYVPTQSQTSVLRHARRITGLPESRIRVITTYLGGGFGRKSNSEFVAEALKIAKKAERPVKLFYTREDDVQSGWFRPMCSALLRGSVDESGMPDSLYFKIAVPAVFEWAVGKERRGVDRAAVSGVANTFYEIPNLRVEFVKSKVKVPVWFWRSVGHTHNAYIMETFIDQLAHLGGRDPVELRLELLGMHMRAQGVIEKVAEASGWHRGPKEGQALGLAYHYSFGTHVAQVAEVSLVGGKVNVHRVVCAVDLGPLVVNPDLVVQQMESGIIMGLSAFLYEGVRFKDGFAVNNNYDTYPILKMEETPEIEVHIVRSEGEMGGIGEPGLPPIAPAVANALFRITGKPVTELPYYGL